MVIIYILILLIIYQDISLIVLNITPFFDLFGNLIIMSKEVVVIGTLLTILIYRHKLFNKINIADTFAILLIVYTTVYVMVPNSMLGGQDITIYFKLLSARTIVIYPLLYLLGRSLIITARQFKNIVNFMFINVIISLVVGIILFMLSNDQLIEIGLHRVFQLKWGEDSFELFEAAFTEGLPTTFYFQELTPAIIPYPGLRRFFGTSMDPVATGFILAVLLFYIFLLEKKNKVVFKLVILGAGIAMTLSKGPFLVLILGFSLILFKRMKSYLVLIAGVILGFILMINYSNFEIFAIGAVKNRITGFIDSISLILSYPLGLGVGSSGFLTMVNMGHNPLTEEFDLISFAVESLLGTIGLQLGFVGVLLFLLFMVFLVRKTYSNWKQFEDYNAFNAKISLATSSIMFGLLFVGILSSTGYGFIGVGLAYLLAGVVISICGSDCMEHATA
jgi:hypothetical protein